MSNLRRDAYRFFARNRDKGIPRLMLWICIGNALVYLFSLFNPELPGLLYFETAKIIEGQVWRLFSYIFTFACNSVFFGSTLLGAILSIFFYYWIGSTLENTCGTLRFNIFYLMGIVLMDGAALLIYLLYPFNLVLTADYLNLSMYLAMATLLPEARVYIYGIIPVKMKWMAWLYFGIIFYNIFQGLSKVLPLSGLPGDLRAALILNYCLPLISLLNYFIFFGSSIKNLTPHFKSIPIQRKLHSTTKQKQSSSSSHQAYRHKCTVCGRTDVDCPDLEFRYCSRCKGYFCYCIDHINNHTHVE